MLTYLFCLGTCASTACHDCQAFVCRAQVGDPLPWIKLEVHNSLDCSSLKGHAAVNWDVSIVCPTGHSIHELLPADVNIFTPRGLNIRPDVLELVPFLDVQKTHKHRNVLLSIPLLAISVREPTLVQGWCLEWTVGVKARATPLPSSAAKCAGT
jgi:hypothetical protein